MTSTSFGNGNSGTQVGTNHGPITQNYFSSGERPEAGFKPGNINWKPLSGSDRLETRQQNLDNEVLESLAFPQMLDRRDNIEPCHTNTCKWILEMEEYQSWRSHSHGLLWIKGKPGVGKSTLMVFLYDELQMSDDDRPGIRLDFFFTARGTEMQRTPLGMLRSLMNQLFDRDPTVRPQIREKYDRRCKQFGYGKRQWEWPQVVLEELLESAILASASQQHMMVFVDALDEAGAKSAQQLAGYFHRLVDHAEKMKLCIQVCISCRHYLIMESGQAIEIKVEDHNRHDIATYIQDKLIKRGAEDTVRQKLREMLVEQLTQQAEGVFQWAHIVLPLIEQKVRERESFDDICCWLRKVPADLEDVYMYILSNVIEVSNRRQSFLFFQWVCLAERPLTVTELRYALVAKNAQIWSFPKRWERINGFVASNEDMTQRIKALSGGLAEVLPSGDNNETVQVVHQSVNDFLRTKGLKVLCQNISMNTSINEDEILCQCQATLYRSCLIYLATIHIPAEISGMKGTSEDLVQDLPFLYYATKNLFVHAEKAADSRSDVVQNEREILQHVLSFWVQVYQKLYPYTRLCPPGGTTLLHMTAAANLVDLIEAVVSDIKDVATRNTYGDTALHLAARWGHVTVGKILQGRGADQEAKNHRGKTPLFEAASGGNMEFVEWLLNQGVELDMKGDEGVLQAACLGGYQSIVEILLRAGADVNAEGGEHGNAICAAAYRGEAEIVEILLRAGTDVNGQGGRYGNALYAAATRGSTEIVQILLRAGADANAQSGVYGNALYAATTERRTDIVEILLDAGADVNAQGGRYGNALCAAATKGRTETVQILLKAGADVNAQGGRYDNALYAAADSGNTETVQVLLRAGADVNAQSGVYSNALCAAATRGSPETVQILLRAGADVNAQGGRYGNALYAAADSGNTETVQVLLRAGADVNAQGDMYGNALQAAATKGTTETVQALLKAGADVNAQGGRYGNALYAAADSGNTEIVQVLLRAGADVNAQSGVYSNALCAAATRGSPETVQILLRAGADVNAQGGGYGNALQTAAHSGNHKTVKILLKAGADVNAQGGEYGNALYAAADSGNTEIVLILLKAGADVNTQGSRYGNALYAAADSGNTETVQVLLRAGADVNAQSGVYSNALYAAAESGNTEIVPILLDAGADVNAQGGRYGNALCAAVTRGSTKAVQILLRAGADVNAQSGVYGNALYAAATRSAEIMQILLDAHADVNAHSGRYGYPLLAAIHEGYVENVQSLLHAGADELITDELGNTPLHIAASRSMLHILFRLPQLASAINNRNIFLQTPLHLAVCHGHIEFAIALLNFGADPSLLDGYGRHIMDWAFDHETLMLEIRNHYPHLVLTPPDTQQLTVHRSIFELTESLPFHKAKSSWPILQQLGRYFLSLAQFDNARYLFQLHLPRHASSRTGIWQISCNMCNRRITGTRFVCTLCACMDLCSSCVLLYPCHSPLHLNQNHEVFEVSNVPEKYTQFTGVTSERLMHVLANLLPKYLEKNADQSETELLNDSTFALTLRKKAIFTKTAFGLVTIGFAILFGVTATFLGAWYF